MTVNIHINSWQTEGESSKSTHSPNGPPKQHHRLCVKFLLSAAPVNARYVCSFGVFVLTESKRLISIRIIKDNIIICKQWPRIMQSKHIIERPLRILIS